ncbi:hypothetical protein D3C73_921040 [compost metagenome]
MRIQRQGFATASNAFEARARLDTRLVNERLEHRRHKVQRADAVVSDEADQLRRFPMCARWRHHQTRAGHQRPEELPDRHVETERGFLQYRIAAIQPVSLLHPAQAVDQRRVTVAGAFGLTGGAGGVDHIGQVQRMHFDLRAGFAVAVEPVVLPVQGDDLDAVGGQCAEQGALREQQANRAVVDHVGQTFGRVLRVQRYVGTTGLVNGQQANDHVQRTLDADPHQYIRANALLAQVIGQSIGAGIELRVAQLALAKHQRRCLGRASGLGLDQLMQALLDGIDLGGAVPVLHQHLLLIGAQHRQLTDFLRRVVD